MTVSIPVTPYVWRYLLSKYGPSPYSLDINRRNPLRMTLSRFELTAEAADHVGRIPYQIELDLGEDRELARAYADNQHALKAGYFFEHEFVQAMRTWVEAQAALGERAGLLMEAGRWAALENFFQAHGITEGDYSLDSAYRRLSRASTEDFQYLREKLGRKFDFWASDNQLFVLAQISTCVRPYLFFWCYSEMACDLVRKKHRIPAKLVQAGPAYWKPYARKAKAVIDEMLLAGYVVDHCPAPEVLPFAP